MAGAFSSLCPAAAEGAGREAARGPAAPIPARADAARQWVLQHTTLDPSDVVLFGQGYILALKPGVDGGVILHEEVSGDALVDRLGGRSAEGYVTFNCERRLTTIQSALVFKAEGGAGQGRAVAPDAFLSASPDAIFDLPKAACDAGFNRPLMSRAFEPAVPSPAASGRPAVRDQDGGLGSGSAAAGRWIQAGAFGSKPLASAAMVRISQAFRAEGLNVPVRLAPVDADPQRKTVVRVMIGPLNPTQDLEAICRRLFGLNLGCLPRRAP